MECDLRHLSWSKLFTTQVGIGCQLQEQWGVTPLTWDAQYHLYVSPDTADEALGSTPFMHALPTVAQHTFIYLDPFLTEQQQQILDQLAQDKTGWWVLMASNDLCKGTV
mmetsp:Transcript_15025/g.30177  ORF Transcript_15025/g.30177 Transcript_15025/m.30177 type:complete len:109 (-) Transcript_15025:14-340(-)